MRWLLMRIPSREFYSLRAPGTPLERIGKSPHERP
jgi:hypothetical protein